MSALLTQISNRLISYLSLFVVLFCIAGPAHSEYSQQAVSYDFVDISATGDIALADCDECGRALEIGFPFTFYGQLFTQLFVSANGFVIPGPRVGLFDDRFECCHGLTMPNSDLILGVIAPWWVDLSMRAEALSSAAEENGKVYTELTGTSGNYVFIVQFNEVRHFHNLATDDANTFQIKLHQSDNRIEFHYKNLVANKNLHSIGIESPKQDEGIQFFRSNDLSKLPQSGKEFALAFSPPESVKQTSSLRYVSEGNTFQHVVEIDTNVNAFAELNVDTFLSAGSILDAGKIDESSASLLQNNPAQIALEYTVLDSLSSEAGGEVSADLVDIELANGAVQTLTVQSVFIEQTPSLSDEAAVVSDIIVSNDQLFEVFKSKQALVDDVSKVSGASDLYMLIYNDSLVEVIRRRLSNFTSNIVCGLPSMDETQEDTYLFVACTTGELSNETIVRRYNLNRIAILETTELVEDFSETKHVFSGDVLSQALVVGRGDVYAYARDDGTGKQDIYLKQGSAAELKVNTTSESISSLGMDEAASKLIYVLDGNLFFYELSAATETLVATGVASASISNDGSMLVFSSDQNLDLSVGNADASQEVFHVLAQTPFTDFEQLTNLPATGECKSPVISERAQRIAVICNEDLLDANNDFQDRQAVFVLENTTGSFISHLLTGVDDKSATLSRLAMSANGAGLLFEDAENSNAFRLSGLSNLSLDKEVSTGEGTEEKAYPVPFILPGDGKSGGFVWILLFILIILLTKFFLLVHYRASLNKA